MNKYKIVSSDGTTHVVEDVQFVVVTGTAVTLYNYNGIVGVFINPISVAKFAE